MSSSSSDETLRNLSLLYLALAHGADDYLSHSEMTAVVHQLEQQFPGEEATQTVQDIVMESLAVYVDAEDPLRLVTNAMLSLRASLSTEERSNFLHDLAHVAHADGIVFHDERGLLRSLAACWEVPLAEASVEQASPGVSTPRLDQEALHDLAFIYLVLGHGTDYELSESERTMMLRRLEEWQPHIEPAQIRAVLDDATSRYAQGPSEDALTSAIQSVRQHLPAEQRMAALNDLIKIANADGVFLDDEEDLINRLLVEWEVDPYANYGSHGSKENVRMTGGGEEELG